MKYEPPIEGTKIFMKDGSPIVSDNPIILFIEGDGTGPDIWAAAREVFDGAVKAAFGGGRKISWMEILAGEKAFNQTGEWLPEATVEALEEYVVSIKGPLSTPVGGGFRSLNVTLRQRLDLYACVRPVRHFKGVPAPVTHPEKLNIVIFRENTEDVYAGLEWPAGSPEAENLITFLKRELNADVRPGSGIGIKPISREGTQRLMRRAIEFALKKGSSSVTIVHKGNIMKYTEGAFKQWCYELAAEEFSQETVTEAEYYGNTVSGNTISRKTSDGNVIEGNAADRNAANRNAANRNGANRNGANENAPDRKLIIKDRIADSMFQQVLLRPDEYDVIATPNLNGDYLSDACAAQVGGLGIAPGANIGDSAALFEATHGTAPKYAGQDKVNPGSLILSGAMMFDYIGWPQAARIIESAIEKTIASRKATYDLARLMEGATLLKCSEFAREIVKNM